MSATKSEVRAAMETLKAIAATIQEVGRAPSGPMYAQLMGKIDLETYEKIVSMLVGAKLIKKEGHELVWIGPAKATKV